MKKEFNYIKWCKFLKRNEPTWIDLVVGLVSFPLLCLSIDFDLEFFGLCNLTFLSWVFLDVFAFLIAFAIFTTKCKKRKLSIDYKEYLEKLKLMEDKK